MADSNVTGLQILWLLTHNDEFTTTFAQRIQPEFFTDARSRNLVKWALEYFNEYGQAITEAGLEKVFEDNEDEINSIGFDVDDVWRLYDNLKPVGEKDMRAVTADAHQFCKDRNFQLAIEKAKQVYENGGADAAWEALDQARAGISVSEIQGIRVLADLDATLRRIGDKESDLVYVPTGVPRLDDMMEKGLRTKELAVFIAPTGRGKTMWLCQCAAMGMLMGNTGVAYYTLEVPADEIFLRTLASASSVKINDLRAYAQGGDRDPEARRYQTREQKEVDPRKLINGFRKRVKLLGGGGDIWVRDVQSRGANLQTIVTDLQRIRRDGGDPKLLIIDYADRLNARGRYDERYKGQEEVFIELAMLAKELDIAIWTASQAGRTGLKVNDLTLDYVQGAFAKTFEASYVVAAGQSTGMAKAKDEEFKFLMAKARRSGSSGKSLYVKHDLSFSRFYGESRIRGEDLDYAEPMSFHHDWLNDEEDTDKPPTDNVRRSRKAAV